MSFAPPLRRSEPPRASSGVRASTDSIALAIVNRLREAIICENEAIARRVPVDHHACSLRKSQGLLELDRLAPSLANAGPSPALRAALADLNIVLNDNQRELRVQLAAAKAVSDIVARAIRDSQSDGTYSAQSWRGREE